jgi:hypothetical protein
MQCKKEKVKINLFTSYPQNFIIRNPFYGSLIFLLFFVGFTWLYHPMDTQRSQMFNFEITMALYSAVASTTVYFSIRLLKLLKAFSNENRWTIIKEIIFIYLVLQVMCIVIYFAGYVIEGSSWEARWTSQIFLDSLKKGFSIGILPFVLFSLLNYSHLLGGKAVALNHTQDPISEDSDPELNIVSKLKRESLSFQSKELLFVTSAGNYVEFYLYRNSKIEKVMIRNSISEIEMQFAHIPHYFRSHRAFIVNLNRVHSKKGNALGYRLRISNSQTEVPVSRQYVKALDQLFH